MCESIAGRIQLTDTHRNCHEVTIGNSAQVNCSINSIYGRTWYYTHCAPPVGAGGGRGKVEIWATLVILVPKVSREPWNEWEKLLFECVFTPNISLKQQNIQNGKYH